MTKEEALAGFKKILESGKMTDENYEKFVEIMTSSVDNFIEVICCVDPMERGSDDYQLATKYHMRAFEHVAYETMFKDIRDNYIDDVRMRQET